MIQSLEIVAKIQGGTQRGEKTDSRLWNCTRKSENRKKKYNHGCTWCTGRTLYCEHGRKSYRCDRDRPWTGQCIYTSLYGGSLCPQWIWKKRRSGTVRRTWSPWNTDCPYKYVKCRKGVGCACRYRDRTVPERWVGTHEHQSCRWRVQWLPD